MSIADETPTTYLAPVSKFAAGVLGNQDVKSSPTEGCTDRKVAFDFPGVEVGTAEYSDGPTGCTVVYLERGARTATDARGGAVGLSGGYEINHAICFTGGSSYGMAAIAGVASELLARNGNRTHWDELKLVSGAVIYDFGVRDNAIVPDEGLGRAALQNAEPSQIPVGRVGAGVSASVGKADHSRAEFAGQGAAFRQIGDVKLLFITVLNSVGVIIDRDGEIVRGNVGSDGIRNHPADGYHDILTSDSSHLETVPGNTTVSALITNAALPDHSLRQLCFQVHSSMHRAIQPFHTERDGDTLFTLTTDELEAADIDAVALATVASEVAWDAVLTALE